jgi:heme oxygenase (biliverdin-IX-beta and delta-forming)
LIIQFILREMSEGKPAKQLSVQQELFLKELRQQTGPQHEALEENKYSKAIGNGTITTAGLRFFMKKFFDFFSPLEEAIYQEGIVPVEDIMVRRKMHLMYQDLLFLRADKTELNSKQIIPGIPEFSSVAAKMGIMYVMEGSTLGGKVIGRMLNKSLGLDNGKGTSFYNSYGENLGPMWKSFVFSLTDYAVKSKNDAEIIQAATTTFASFKNWLEKDSDQ